MMTALLATLTAWAVAALFQRAVDMSPAMLAAPTVGVTVGVATVAHTVGVPSLWSPIIVGVSAYALALMVDLAAYALEERGMLQRVLPTPEHDMEEVIVRPRHGKSAYLDDEALKRIHHDVVVASMALASLRDKLRAEGVEEKALGLTADTLIRISDGDKEA